MATRKGDTSTLRRRPVVAFAKKTKAAGGDADQDGEAEGDGGDAGEGPDSGAPHLGDGAKSATSNAAPSLGAQSDTPQTDSADPGAGADRAGDGYPRPGEGAKSATSNAAPDPVRPDAGAPGSGTPGGAEASGASADGVEDPTAMPIGTEIPAGEPDSPAAAPGEVPRGDSRSLRRPGDSEEFVLIYRRQTQVITRFGVVGTRGQWKVVDYPTSGAAANAFARECSRFVAEGFSDYRS